MSCYRKGGCGPYEMYSCYECPASKPEYAKKYVSQDKPPINTIGVTRIEEVKQDILRTLDVLITHYQMLISPKDNGWSYYDGKLEGMEIARRLMNAALTDLCSQGE